MLFFTRCLSPSSSLAFCIALTVVTMPPSCVCKPAVPLAVAVPLSSEKVTVMLIR